MNADYTDASEPDGDRAEISPGRGSMPKGPPSPEGPSERSPRKPDAVTSGALRREVLESLEADGPQDSRRDGHPAAKLAGVGLQFAGVVLVFTLGGHWLDQRLGAGPWLLLIGLALGLVGGGLSLILSVQRTLR